MKPKFEHKKSLGQHFLNNDVVPKWLVETGAVGALDIILEIGPGTGALTAPLLKTNAKVIALEADERALTILNETFAAEVSSGQLTLIHKDVRSLNLAEFGLTDHSFKVVSNIPYYLSGYLFRTLLESPIQPSDLIFLVQKEVAKRVVESVERGGKSSLLSLSTQVYGTTTYVRTVSSGHFTPPPKVDSAIIAITDITRNNFTKKCSEVNFFTLIHAGFASKRKQLQGNLRVIVNDQAAIAETIAALGVSPAVRAEDLNLKQWLDLTESLSEHLPHPK